MDDLPWQIHESMDVPIHMPRLHVCSQEALAIWEWMAHHCMWPLERPLSSWACQGEGFSEGTAHARIQWAWQNCGAAPLSYKAFVGNGKDCHIGLWFLCSSGVIELCKHGVFAAALIKKQKYWPKYIRRDEIQQDFSSLSVGTCDAWRGSLDGVDFHDFCMKEPTYVMMLMSTYGTLHPMGHIKHWSWVENGLSHSSSFCIQKWFTITFIITILSMITMLDNTPLSPSKCTGEPSGGWIGCLHFILHHQDQCLQCQLVFL